ncbi:helix-turn-helix transcriptional regulator [Lysinibacillus sp. 54212]|uniref:helix-turn-helix transcriptional regulator n=1 Tax=Lysinibacillus sp. 54212 TaxID=3119829 RepID=UPI002FCC8C35
MTVENARLVSLRKSKNLTQEQLAENVGITQAMVARIESGERDPSSSNKIKLAKFFGVTVEHLFYENRYGE